LGIEFILLICTDIWRLSSCLFSH